jgi:hypothetical protein
MDDSYGCPHIAYSGFEYLGRVLVKGHSIGYSGVKELAGRRSEMRGSQNQAQVSQTIEFKGHLIDSLTLSKIADHIEQLNGNYELNDIRIGAHRQDISAINITVFADSETKLKEIFDDLKPYGAVSSGESSVEFAACDKNGKLPEHAFSIRLPQKVFLNGEWLPLEEGQALTLVIDQSKKIVRLSKVEDVCQGEQVIIGNHGIVW